MAGGGTSLSEALGPNGQLIVNLIPELELMIGKQPPVADLPPQDARNRFQMVFRRFLGVFARKEHPLALFLDDLQWLDAATLDLLEHLVTHPEVRHLLLVGAYRDNEVGPAHPLIRTLEAIRDAGARVEEIVLTPLGLDDIGRLVTDALHCEPEHARPLAQLVHEKTSGNPFFAIQFLTALNEDGLLAFDPVAPAWRWDIDRIRARSYTDNVADLLVEKMKRLSVPAQEAMKQLACLGNAAEVATLALVYEANRGGGARGAVGGRPRRPRPAAGERLHVPARPDPAGGLFADPGRAPRRRPPAHRPRAAGDHDGGPVRRASVRCREPAQSGRRTADRPGRESAGGDDRPARRAKGQGVGGLCVGVRVSCGRHGAVRRSDWGSQYELMFSLWLERAECEFLTGDFDTGRATDRASCCSAARRKSTRRPSTTSKVPLHTVKSEIPQAVDSALTCLRLFGIDLPAHPTWEQVQAEYETVWQILDGRPIESLIDLPLMTDPELQAAMQMLVRHAPARLLYRLCTYITCSLAAW